MQTVLRIMETTAQSFKYQIVIQIFLLLQRFSGFSVRSITYRNQTFKIHFDKKDQYAAEIQCKNDNGDLAYFHNTQEYEYVVKELTKIGESTGVTSFFIGKGSRSTESVVVILNISLSLF